MKNSARVSFVLALVFGALSLHLAGCATETRVEEDEIASTSSALVASRAATSGIAESATGAAQMRPPFTLLPGKGVPPPPYLPPDPCYPPPMVLSFAAPLDAITLGDSVTLSWNVLVPNSCAYTVLLAGQAETTETVPPQSVGLQGSMAFQPSSNTRYILTVVGPNRSLSGSAEAGVRVDLPNDPLAPGRKWVSITAPPSIDLFLQALNTANTTVLVDNSVDLDLSGFTGIQIAAGVTLAGGRTAAPGLPFQPGPRLFTTTAPSRLFEVVGPRVHITGLRFQGRLNLDPPEIASDESSIGLSLGSTSWNPQEPSVEIDHNEFYGWSNAGIEVAGDKNAQAPSVQSKKNEADNSLVYDATPEPAIIHDNYFHHNLHTSGLGYGVVVGSNGHALIQSNVFDWNRHAISDDGSTYSGYRAYRNLVLEHGGYNFELLWTWNYIQQFDMHGQDNCGIQSWFSDTQFNCGRAGHDLDIRYNSFSYTSAAAIKVRGTPELGAFVDSNVFAHVSLFDTLVSSGRGEVVRPGAVEWTESPVGIGAKNQVGATWDQIDSCDFDGDAIPDRFLATGQTWWFSSNWGQGPWVYLNASTLRLGAIALGDVDGDGLCDVTAGGVTYRGGTTLAKGELRELEARGRGSMLVRSKGLPFQ